jgi:hypothetical protein
MRVGSRESGQTRKTKSEMAEGGTTSMSRREVRLRAEKKQELDIQRFAKAIVALSLLMASEAPAVKASSKLELEDPAGAEGPASPSTGSTRSTDSSASKEAA